MPQEAKYSYIRWLPENRIVIATQQAMLQDKYIAGLFGKNIFAYSRDDNADFMLPSLSVNQLPLYSPAPRDRIVGAIVIDAYFGTDLIRNKTTEAIQTTMATIRSRIQNYRFIQSVALNMFDYNESLSLFQTEFDKNQFKYAMQNRHPLQQYGIELYSNPATSTQLSNKVTCYKGTIKFKYWLMQQDYEEFLELLGINEQVDPNKIVYNLWEEIFPDIEEI